MSVRRTIENNEKARIRPSKTYQTIVAVAWGHHELNFIEKDVRNYITREVHNVSELEDVREFGKFLLRMKEKNQNFFFELKLKDDQSIKITFWADARSRAACEYFGDVISFDTTCNTNRYNLVCGSFVGVNHHESEELTAILHRAYDNVIVEMQELKDKRKETCSLSHEDTNLESVNELQSPPRVRTRGRPKNRLGSKLDKQIANASKKKKTKTLSELNLFYGASVVQSNFSKYHGHVMNYQFRDLVAGHRCLSV
ncbi:hypothetical protein Ahy_B09g096663 isoform A [Arachis hypogaea]|uniref:Uncharacterized protein n=1 Tax=Arachis hypogaea TaxID=3818 RepID=A0A444XLX5_ARAHY|nr:hypothetical protein Ahy_B09g096663 isoform A [Arachis hypogaea]